MAESTTSITIHDPEKINSEKKLLDRLSENEPIFTANGVKALKSSSLEEAPTITYSDRTTVSTSEQPSYNVLFYIEPMMTFHRPLFHLPWWNFAYRKIKSLENDPFHRYSFRVITSRAIREHIPDVKTSSDLLILEIESEELLRHFEGDYLKASLAWYNRQFTEQQISYTSMLVQDKLKKWEPDIIISYSPAPFLQQAYPKAFVLYSEYGMTSRPPFPESFYFDPLGYYKYSFLRRYPDRIRSTHFSKEDHQALELYRKYFTSLIDQRNPYKPLINSLLAKFNHLILVPLQASQHCSFDGNCHFLSQFHMMEYVLTNTPDSIGVIFTSHPDFPVFTPDLLAYLQKRYPHFIYFEELEYFSSASQYLIGYVDAVASVSSMVGLQTLIWQKKLIALGDSHLNFVADATSLGQISTLLSQETPNRDNVLLWLLSHYFVPLSYVQDPIWFGGFLERAYRLHLSDSGIEEFYTQIDHVPTVIEQIIKNSNPVIPIVKKDKFSKSSYLQLYSRSGEEDYSEENSLVATIPSDKWHSYYFSLYPKDNENLHLRIDPCNHAALIEIRQISIREQSTKKVIWQADGSTPFKDVTIAGTAIKLISPSDSLLLFSYENDPQIILSPLPSGIDSGIELEIAMKVSNDFTEVSKYLSSQEQSLRSQRLTKSALEHPEKSSYVLSMINFVIECLVNKRYRFAKEALAIVLNYDPNNPEALVLLDYLFRLSRLSPTSNIYDGNGLIASNLDAPLNGEVVKGVIDVYGWFLSDQDSLCWNIQVLVDRKNCKLSIERGEREDVLEAHNAYREYNPFPGFGTKLDTTQWQDGEHQLTIIAFNESTVEQIASLKLFFANDNKTL